MLHGLKAISDLLECDTRTVRRYVEEGGAPIRVVGRGRGRRYIAERSALLAWVRLSNS